MLFEGSVGLFLGTIGLGLVHGILPDHGWPVAAMYALDRRRPYLYGFLSGFILGFGHLFSSIAVVVAFLWAQSRLGFGDPDWLHYVAGGLLIALGVREYLNPHSHSHGVGDENDGHESDHEPDHHEHSHDHHDHEHSHGHSHDHDHANHHHGGIGARILDVLPFGDRLRELDESAADERGLWGIALFAFALGFAHNEEIEILALCLGAEQCLALMTTYALAVLVAIVVMTLLLVAGYEHYQDRVEAHADKLPKITAVVLILMGIGFVAGVF